MPCTDLTKLIQYIGVLGFWGFGVLGPLQCGCPSSPLSPPQMRVPQVSPPSPPQMRVPQVSLLRPGFPRPPSPPPLPPSPQQSPASPEPPPPSPQSACSAPPARTALPVFHLHLELIRRPPELAHPLTQLAGQHRQPLRPKQKQRQDKQKNAVGKTRHTESDDTALASQLEALPAVGRRPAGDPLHETFPGPSRIGLSSPRPATRHATRKSTKT